MIVNLAACSSKLITINFQPRLSLQTRPAWTLSRKGFGNVGGNAPCLTLSTLPTSKYLSCTTASRTTEDIYDNEIFVRQVERASFDPLVFTTSGSASSVATVVLNRPAARLAEARDLSFSTVMGCQWLHCTLSASAFFAVQ